ncbi:Hint domain-containing protein [Pseudosulfitobacter koreensis]|uniref:Hint domain-containing protein n=1 Tax=Pseudosulfitobacter koreensis TaxID=2968472 RepID=A0ABT1YW56_9RHOB|nr:Hint domain-containing protein [Pseudosulfitobacter koreense]MCR8825106.1 Hint domain-containing protein [Pseudosulfitobacter koreense]
MDKDETTGNDSIEVLRSAAVLTSFGPGTMLHTTEGEVPIEWLDTGHKLLTLDHGAQPIVQINRIRLLRSDLRRHSELSPVVLPPDTFGPSIPGHHVRISPNSLVLYRSPRAELDFGSSEVLVSGNMLAEPMPLRRPGDTTFVYTQILMQRHELLSIEGMWVGSLFVADLNAMDTEKDDPLVAALGKTAMVAARPILTRTEARALLAQDLGGRSIQTRLDLSGH